MCKQENRRRRSRYNRFHQPTFWLFVAMCIPGSLSAQEIDRVVHLEGKPRAGKVELVVVHATGGPSCNPRISFKSGTLNGIVNHFKNSQDKISIHYIIGRDGATVQMVPEHRVAWHVACCNGRSIGIELINNGDGEDPYSEKQIASLTRLLKSILKRHGLDGSAIKGHSDLDKRTMDCGGEKIRRKVDPGANFPWERVRAALGT